MPKLSGRDLVAQLRQRDPDLRVVYMSGHPTEPLADGSDWQDTSVFLQKPFKMLELARAIRAVLDSPRPQAR